MNKVGPFWNPQETYHFYTLPICRPDKIEHRSLTLGEVLDGDRMARSMYRIQFKKNSDNSNLCTASLTQKDINMLAAAIEDFYYFEYVADDIPMRGFVGKFEEENLIPHVHHMYIYTHYDFYFEYNGNKVSYFFHTENILNLIRKYLELRFFFRLFLPMLPLKIEHLPMSVH